MKYHIIVLLFLISLPGFAQEYKHKVAANQVVKIQYHKSQIVVEGHKGNELVIQATNFEAPPERAKGLRPLYNAAVDNTGIGLSVEVQDGALVIKEASQQGADYVIRVPEGARLSIEQMNWGGGGDINVKGMRNELEIKSKNAEVQLLDVTGPVIANSTSGNIVVRFREFSQAGPSSISSVASDVDVSLPANAKAALVMSSVVGEIYTDLELQMQNKGETEPGMTHLGGGGDSTIRANYNGGGASLTIRTTSNNIYVRKR